MKKLLLPAILAGVLITIASFIVNFTFQLVFPEFQAIYSNTAIFLGWEEPRTLFFWLYPFALSLGLAWLYTHLPKKSRKTSTFAALYFVVAGIPMFFINVGSMNLPVAMVFSWTVSMYLNGLLAGCLFEKMLK